MLLSASLEVLGDFLEVKLNITVNVFFTGNMTIMTIIMIVNYSPGGSGGTGSLVDGATSELVEQVNSSWATWLSIILVYQSWFSWQHGFLLAYPGINHGQYDFHLFILFGHQAIQQWISNGGIENLIMQVLYLSPWIIFVLYEIYICQFAPVK